MDPPAKKAVPSVRSAVWLGPLELVARVDDDRVADRIDGRVHDKWPSAVPYLFIQQVPISSDRARSCIAIAFGAGLSTVLCSASSFTSLHPANSIRAESECAVAVQSRQHHLLWTHSTTTVTLCSAECCWFKSASQAVLDEDVCSSSTINQTGTVQQSSCSTNKAAHRAEVLGEPEAVPVRAQVGVVVQLQP